MNTPNEYSSELEVAHPPARAVDLRNQTTDSWTDVLGDVIALARGIHATEFVPVGLRGSEAKVSAAILYGRELGLMPLTALGATHVIEGKAGISAEMMRALVLQAGHELHIVESTRERCKIRGRRRGSEEWTEAVWTIQEARQTQVYLSKAQGWGPLSEKSQWRSWPTEMLLARATTRLVRMIFPDVAHGMRSVEELHDMTEVVEGVVEGPPVVEPVKRQRPKPTARGDKRAATPPAEPVDAEAVDAEVVAADTVEAPTADVKPVQRRRVDPPAPRARVAEQPNEAATALGEFLHATAPGAVVDELDDDAPAEVVDAEVVDAEPAGMTEEQRKAVAAAKPEAFRKAVTVALLQFERLGVTDRTERLWYTGVLIGREVTTTNELDLDEVRRLVNQLERAKSIDAINALIDKGNTNE